MRKLMEAVTRRLDLPETLLDGTARVTLTGGTHARIENHRCLLAFSPETLEVACGKQRVRLVGTGLRILCMDRQEIQLSGRILTVEVENA